MKKQIKLVMVMFAVMLFSVTSAFAAYDVEDLTSGAMKGEIDRVSKNLSNGVNVNERDSGGRTALYYASRENKTTMMKFLISKGAAVDRPNNDGNFPLYIAAKNGYLEAVKILVYNGCDVNKTNNGKTALQVAQDEGFTNVVKFLKEQGSKSSSSSSSSSSAKADVHTFIVAAQNGNLDTVKKQVSLGVDINAIDNKLGWTALTYAANNGHTEVLKYIISKGADVNKPLKNPKDGTSASALYYAARQGKLDCVKTLVEAKADINAKIITGKTPLQIAQENGHTEVVNYLKSKGAK